MKYYINIGNIAILVYWYHDKSGKERISIEAMQYGRKDIIRNKCTLAQFKNGYAALKFLEQFRSFDNEEYKFLKQEILDKVIKNSEYHLEAEQCV